MTTGPRILAYAPPRSQRRWIVRLLLLIAGVVCACFWGPEALRAIHLYWIERRCATYRAAENELAYVGDRYDVMQEFLRARPDFAVSSKLDRGTATEAFIRPACWDDLWSSVRNYRSQFYATSTHREAPVLFLHERTSSGGTRRIVAVEYVGAFEFYGFVTISITPGFWHSPMERKRCEHSFANQEWKVFDHEFHCYSLRIYQGQPDPNDDSAFSIRFTFDGAERIVRGQLLDSGEVKLWDESVRTGTEPATR